MSGSGLSPERVAIEVSAHRILLDQAWPGALLGALLALFACVSGACVAVPVVPDHPSEPMVPLPGPIVGARFGVDPEALTTSRDLPQRGSEEHERLRSFLVRQLNATSRARPSADAVLPTTARIETDRPPFGRRERFHVGLATTLPTGQVVNTSFDAANDVPSFGAGLPCWAMPAGCVPCPFNLVFLAAMAGPEAMIAATAVAVLLSAAAVGVVVALATSGFFDDLADPRRAVRLSNLLQRAIERHARSVWEELGLDPAGADTRLPEGL